MIELRWHAPASPFTSLPPHHLSLRWHAPASPFTSLPPHMITFHARCGLFQRAARYHVFTDSTSQSRGVYVAGVRLHSVLLEAFSSSESRAKSQHLSRTRGLGRHAASRSRSRVHVATDGGDNWHTQQRNVDKATSRLCCHQRWPRAACC